MTTHRFSLFACFGVELEYMVVDRQTLDIRPVVDWLLEQAGGPGASDVERGAISWSNELVRHVVELKTTEPATDLAPLAGQFQDEVRAINGYLEAAGAQLMPTAMHPWMQPAEMELWPLACNEIYRAFDRIFHCQGHGWANLQSVHLNLPFADDRQFSRLHTAVRLVLPLLPALAASSPVVERQVTPWRDNRLEYYRTNARRVPLVTGQVIPEPVEGRREYEEQILGPMYRQIAPLDPERILQHEWLNARGAIARFDRGSLEIRLLDLQECPQADLALCALIADLLRQLVQERWTDWREQQAVGQEVLVELLRRCSRMGELAEVDDPGLLRQFGVPDPEARRTTGELWGHLADELARIEPGGARLWRPVADHLLAHGTLATRIVRALEDRSLEEVYAALCRSLADGELFAA